MPSHVDLASDDGGGESRRVGAVLGRRKTVLGDARRIAGGPSVYGTVNGHPLRAGPTGRAACA